MLYLKYKYDIQQYHNTNICCEFFCVIYFNFRNFLFLFEKYKLETRYIVSYKFQSIWLPVVPICSAKRIGNHKNFLSLHCYIATEKVDVILYEHLISSTWYHLQKIRLLTRLDIVHRHMIDFKRNFFLVWKILYSLILYEMNASYPCNYHLMMLLSIMIQVL